MKLELPLPRPATAACGMGDQRIIVRLPRPVTNPCGPLTPLSHRSQWTPVERAGPSVMDRPAVFILASPGDRMPIAASEGELTSGNDDSAALSPSGSVTLP